MSTAGTIRGRPITEVVMVILALTISLVLVLSVVLLGVLEILHPEASTDAAITGVQSVVSVLVGALLGFLAGKSGGLTSRAGQDV